MEKLATIKEISLARKAVAKMKLSEQEKLKKHFLGLMKKRGKFSYRCLVISKSDSFSSWTMSCPSDLLTAAGMSKTYNLPALARKMTSLFHMYRLRCPHCMEDISIINVGKNGSVEFRHENSVGFITAMGNFGGLEALGVPAAIHNALCIPECPLLINKNSELCVIPMSSMLPWRPVWRMA